METQPYTEEECDRLREQVEDLREDQYLEDVFGMTGYLETEDWMKVMCKKGKWIFDSTEVRKRIFKLAEIEVRHA